MWTVPSTVYVDHIPNKKSILIADETNWPLIQWINKGRMVNYSIYIYIYIYSIWFQCIITFGAYSHAAVHAKAQQVIVK